MANKKVKFNECYVRGEVLDIYDIKKLFEGETYEKLAYKLKIEVAENETRTVECFANVYDFAGEESKIYKGLYTIANEVKTRAENGKGDMVNCTGKIIGNSYYNKGELIEGFRVVMDFCNREERGKKITPGTVWKAHVLIQEVNELDEYIEIVGLTNEYMSTNSVRGHIIKFRVADKELAKDFLEVYKVGDVAQLEGKINEITRTVQLDASETEELPVTGIGSKREKIIEENERRNKLREEGVTITETYLEITGGDEPLEDVSGTPFTDDKVDTVLNKIDEELAKSKEKDEKKNGSVQEINEMEVPF